MAQVDRAEPEKKATITLLLLAPIFGEILSGSTPLVALLFLPLFSFNIALYGCGALLIRELARRRQLGWANIWVLGLAYGVLEEGLVTTSWFNPNWPQELFLHGYGTFLSLNWVSAIALTLYHATFSITIPIIYTELLYPSVAQTPWIGRKGLRRAALGLGFASALGLTLFGFLAFRSQGYHLPPSYFLAVLLFFAFAYVGLRWRQASPTAGTSRLRRPVVLALLSFGVSLVFLVLGWGGQALLPHLGFLTVALIAAVVLFAFQAVRRLSSSPGFSTRHLVALMFGPIALFALLQLPRGLPQALDALLGALVLWRLVKASSDAELGTSLSRQQRFPT